MPAACPISESTTLLLERLREYHALRSQEAREEARAFSQGPLFEAWREREGTSHDASPDAPGYRAWLERMHDLPLAGEWIAEAVRAQLERVVAETLGSLANQRPADAPAAPPAVAHRRPVPPPPAARPRPPGSPTVTDLLDGMFAAAPARSPDA